MSQVDPALEHEYVFSDRYAERGEVYRSIAKWSEQARREWPAQLDLAYGSHPRERLDLFPGPSDSPLIAFLHGGYWSSHDKSSFSFVAPPFVKRGFSVAVVGYPLAPETPLAAIVATVRKSLRWLTDEWTAPLPGRRRLYLCGHSAGGHLAVAASIDEGTSAPGPSVARYAVAGCAPLSGIFDLTPIARTSIASRIGLRESQARALSPLYRPPPSGWLLAAVGGAETRGFLGQTARYVERCRVIGKNAEVLELPSANHYTVLRDLGRDDGSLVGAIHSRALQDTC